MAPRPEETSTLVDPTALTRVKPQIDYADSCGGLDQVTSGSGLLMAPLQRTPCARMAPGEQRERRNIFHKPGFSNRAKAAACVTRRELLNSAD